MGIFFVFHGGDGVEGIGSPCGCLICLIVESIGRKLGVRGKDPSVLVKDLGGGTVL